jgi:hypothetical protein
MPRSLVQPSYDLCLPVHFTLHIRPNFLYSACLEIFDQFDQAHQVFESAHRSPCGENHERIGLTDIGPSAWKISHLSILGIVKHPPLAPTQAAIDKLKLPPTPGVKRMSYTKISC